MGELSVFLGGMEELSVLRVVWDGTVLHYFLLHKKWTSVMTVM